MQQLRGNEKQAVGSRAARSRGNSWPVQARLRLTRVQKDQLAEQGTENATVLAMQQGQGAGIASMLQVCT